MREHFFVIDKYNKYHKNEDVRKIFFLTIGGKRTPYCIREVAATGYYWGKPNVGWEEQDPNLDYSDQCLYDSIEDAENFIREIQ